MVGDERGNIISRSLPCARSRHPQTRTSCSSPSSLQLTSALRITALSLVKPMEEAEAILTPNDMYF